MIIGPLARNAEKVFMVIKNVSGAVISAGYLVNYCIGGNSFDGVSAVLAASGTTADLPGFIGVANADIANTAYGIVQCWGFAGSVRYSNVGSSVTINQGDLLIPGAGAGGAFSGAAPSAANAGLKYIIASNVPVAISAAGYLSGFVRCI